MAATAWQRRHRISNNEAGVIMAAAKAYEINGIKRDKRACDMTRMAPALSKNGAWRDSDITARKRRVTGVDAISIMYQRRGVYGGSA